MNIIQPEELEQILRVRDMGIARVDAATRTRKRQLEAKNNEEYDKIPIPRLYPFNNKSVFIDSLVQKDMNFQYDVLLDMYCKGFTINDNGYIVSRYGNLGAVAISDLYRGELRDYGNQCTSTLGRKIQSSNINECIIEFFIAQMRILYFYKFLTYFKQFTDFKIGTPMAHIIAQHYGLNTQFLDLTDDVKVALFFACCKHIGNNKYRPIGENDLSELGEYGVLYHGCEDEFTQVIGYQPFTRCYKQRGYYIDTAVRCPCWEFSLTKMDNFTKSIFKRTPELSKKIFEEFEGGQRLFPKDSLFYFEEQISYIKTTKVFPEEIFEETCDLITCYLGDYVERGVMRSEILRLVTKDWLRNMSKEHEISYSERIQLPSGVSVIIENLNKIWNPSQYVKDEDILAWGRETIRSESGFYLSKGVGGIYMIDEV